MRTTTNLNKNGSISEHTHTESAQDVGNIQWNLPEDLHHWMNETDE
jgi:hypothetical protein